MVTNLEVLKSDHSEFSSSSSISFVVKARLKFSVTAEAICGRHGFRPLPSLARFTAFQNDAAVFGHTPSWFDAILLQ
jgi:hypothetical protein